ncbi:acyl-CoA dehydrogenase family protein [Glutamicibacter sp. M10]|uniref:acyl-CoA dehydrogenase family protein n=1 Tax=Glutamicibacter sp. M10 TaxID=3023076 RepID=UPI0021C97F38|nr:acyl-CoA dehydrogenase family protein [Glutamicibacter sp. M10]UXN32869.1 acyl-CoA dehydrogenase family protein [Glutamicibacter sp. M10]
MFEISDDQKSLIGMVHDFAETKIAPMAQKWDEEQHFPIDVLAQAGQLGMGGIYASEEHGGSALTRSDAVLVFEELAKADPTLAAYISIHNMVVWMVDSFGNDEQRAKWLPDLISMEQLGSYCLTEPGIGSDAAALSTRARKDGDEYVLSGVKQFISGAGSSGLYIVMARTADTGARGISAFLVPADLPGLSFGANEKKMGWKAQPTRQVIMEGVRIPAENLLGEEGQGFSMAKKVATDAGFNVANSAIQLHGGYGYLADYGMEKIFRDLRVHQILEGTNEIMSLIVGRSLLDN